LNTLSVLYRLSERIPISKVQTTYPFHPSSRVAEDEARLHMTKDEVTAYAKTVGACA